jgi:hypothetical protein
MFKRFMLLAATAALLVVGMAPAAGAAVDRFDVPISGDSFVCGDTSLTITQGVARIRAHATGGNLSVSIRPVGVRAVDADGNEATMVGSETVRGAFNSSSTVWHQTFHMTFIASDGGGLIGRASTILHITANANNKLSFAMDTGSCEGPISPG